MKHISWWVRFKHLFAVLLYTPEAYADFLKRHGLTLQDVWWGPEDDE